MTIPGRPALLLFVVCTARISAIAIPQVLFIDNTHSSIQFSVPFVGVTEVTGNFERFCGTFSLDDNNVQGSSLELFVDAGSINTGLKIRDRDMRVDNLKTATYPIIYFKSETIRLIRPRVYDVSGQLTLHGKSKTVRLILATLGDVINADGGRELGLKLQSVVINRLDFGVMEGSTTVGDSVTISASIRLRDILPYRKDFDVRHPDAPKQTNILHPGKYRTSAGKTIVLISYLGKDFIAFDDNEWEWFAELKSIGPNSYKTRSFPDMIEVRDNQLIFITQDKSEVFYKAE